MRVTGVLYIYTYESIVKSSLGPELAECSYSTKIRTEIYGPPRLVRESHEN